MFKDWDMPQRTTTLYTFVNRGRTGGNGCEEARPQGKNEK